MKLFPESFIEKAKRFLNGSFFLLFFIFFIASLQTHHHDDYSFNTYSLDVKNNCLGACGSFFADFFIQLFGAFSYAISLIFLYISLAHFLNKKILWSKISFFVSLILSLCLVVEKKSFENFWSLGGFLSGSSLEQKYIGYVLCLLSLVGLFYNVFPEKKVQKKSDLLILPSLSSGESSFIQKKEPFFYQKEIFFTEDLKKALEEFSIEGEILEQYQGPIVSSFLFRTASQIKSLRLKNLAYELREFLLTSSVRITDHPKGVLIEVANKTPQIISLSNCSLPDKTKFKLPLILGKNTTDETLCIDITKLPHLLVGGFKGKTNFLNHILHTQHQAEFRLIDDPKKREWEEHKDYLLDPQIALKTIVKEIEKRYRSISKIGVKNIEEFNQSLTRCHSVKRTVQTGFDDETGKPIFESQALHYHPFPYQIILVQELMTLAPSDEEQDYLHRCCSMARGAGIHFIIATKHRPSSLMQSTFPAKLSFKTSSRFESLALIDGAEYLCPYGGDALFKNGNTQRVHTILSESHESFSLKKQLA